MRGRGWGQRSRRAVPKPEPRRRRTELRHLRGGADRGLGRPRATTALSRPAPATHRLSLPCRYVTEADRLDLALPGVIDRLAENASRLLRGMEAHGVLRVDEIDPPLRLPVQAA